MSTTKAEPFWIETEDWHTAGEPFRIVKDLPEGYTPPGKTVAERRQHLIQDPDHPLNTLRQALCHEPRGHADMYGGFIMPPDDDGAYFGVLFWHKDGFSTACGHGTIALGYWAVKHDIPNINASDKEVLVTIDVPSGRVSATMALNANLQPIGAQFTNVKSYQLARDVRLSLPSVQSSDFGLDLSFGGAVYASVSASHFGLKVEPQNVDAFIRLGREIKATLGKRGHYGTYDLYGVIFYEDNTDSTSSAAGIIRQRNVTVFADGQIDRSPCGSGTAARLAVLLAEGRLRAGCGKLVHTSIVASVFEADILQEEESSEKDFPACIPQVRGTANLVGYMKFIIDETDLTFPGFVLR